MAHPNAVGQMRVLFAPDHICWRCPIEPNVATAHRSGDPKELSFLRQPAQRTALNHSPPLPARGRYTPSSPLTSKFVHRPEISDPLLFLRLGNAFANRLKMPSGLLHGDFSAVRPHRT